MASKYDDRDEMAQAYVRALKAKPHMTAFFLEGASDSFARRLGLLLLEVAKLDVEQMEASL